MKLSMYAVLCSIVAAFAAVAPSAGAVRAPLGVDEGAVTYQIDPVHSGATTAALSLPLHILWSVDVGQGVSYPLIADGRVFVVAGSALVALDAATGNTLWTQTTTSSYGWVGAAYEQGRVFAQASLVFSGAGMFAYAEKTGHQIWAASLPGQYLFSSPPTALNGMLFTGGAGSGGTVYALRTSDGSSVWTASVANGDDSSPVVTKDGVYVSYACPQTYKFNTLTGAPIWHYSGPCEGGGGSTGVLYDGLLFVEDSFINTHNGAILTANHGVFRGSFDSQFTPAFANDIAYLVQNGGSNLTAVNASTGAQLWTVAANTNDSFRLPALVSTSLGVVFESTSQGLFVGYNATTGKPVLSMSLNQTGGGTGMAAAPNLIIVPVGTHVVALGP